MKSKKKTTNIRYIMALGFSIKTNLCLTFVLSGVRKVLIHKIHHKYLFFIMIFIIKLYNNSYYYFKQKK